MRFRISNRKPLFCSENNLIIVKFNRTSIKQLLSEYHLTWIDKEMKKHKSTPVESGVYVFLIKNERTRKSSILYIGSSINLKARLCCHSIIGFSKRIESYYTISVKYALTEQHDDIERRLISKFKPSLNIQYNWKYSKERNLV